MKHLAKRTLSLLLAALMVLTIIPANPTTARAAADISIVYGYEADGTCTATHLGLLNKNSGASQFDNYSAVAVTKSKSAIFGMSAAARAQFSKSAGYDGNLRVEVEYYTGDLLPGTSYGIAQNLSISYYKIVDGKAVATEVTNYTTASSDREGTEVAVFELTAAEVTSRSYGSYSNVAFMVNNKDTGKYLAIRTVKIVDPDSAPVFVTTSENYPAVFYDNQEFEDIYIGNEFREKNIQVKGTVLLNGEPTAITNKTIPTDSTLPAYTGKFIAVSKEVLANALKDGGAYPDGTYSLTVKVIWDKVGQEITQTYTFTRKNTIDESLKVYNEDVLYSYTNIEGCAETEYPNHHYISGTGTESDGTPYTLPQQRITDAMKTDPETGAKYFYLIKTGEETLKDGIYTFTTEAWRKDGEGETLTETQRTSNTVKYIKCSEHDYGTEESPSKTCTKCGFVKENSSSFVLENNMKHTVYVDLDNYITKVGEKPNGAYALCKGQTTPLLEYKDAEGNATGDYYFEIDGLAAKDLSKEYQIALYDKYGNKIGEFTESFAAYAKRVFNDASKNSSWTMIADMIDYATKAQQYFAAKEGKEVGVTVHDQMDGFNYQQYYSVAPTCTDNRAPAFEEAKAKGYIGTNFTLGDKITMNLFTTTNLGYAKVTFTDHYGKEHTMYPAAEVKGEGYYVYRISEFVTADGGVVDGDSVVVTAEFYENEEAANAEAATPILTVKDSMASYVARAIEANAENEAFLQAMMKFTTSSRAYFAE